MGRRKRASRKPTTLCFVCGAAVLLAGCGSSGHKASTTRTGSTSSTAPAASTAPGGIRAHLLASNELSGFTSSGVAVYATAQQWVSSPPGESAAQAAAEKAMLTREGFKAAATENLAGGYGSESGLSIAEQFRSAAAARTALAFYVSRLRAPSSTAGAYAPFKVSGIPGAVGFSLGGANGGGINIAFAQGDYYYLVGEGGGSPATVAALNAAARHLYQRVSG